MFCKLKRKFNKINTSEQRDQSMATIGATKYVIALIISKWTFTVSYQFNHFCRCEFSMNKRIWKFQWSWLKLGCFSLTPSPKEKGMKKFLTVKLKNKIWSRNFIRGMDAEEGGRKWQEIWSVRKRAGRERDVCGKHMEKVSNFYITLIGCNEINFYCKFIDTAKTRHLTEGRKSSTAHGWNI